MRFGIIGTSWITQTFVRGTMLRNSMRLTAVYSRSFEKGKSFSSEFGNIPVFTSLTQMFSSGLIDAVYIASPNALHYEQSKIALENGLHVLCEKPVAVTAAQFSELCALAKRNGLVYMEAIIPLYQPARAILHDAISEIGDIYTARLDFSQLSSKYNRLIQGEQINSFDSAMGGGCLMDIGIYCVYAAVDLFGLPDDIRATAGFLRRGVEAYGSAVFRYPDREIMLTYSKVGQSGLGSEVIGSTGTVLIHSVSCYTGITLVKNGKVNELVGEIEREALMANEADAFVKYVSSAASSENELDKLSRITFSVCEIMEKIRESAGIKLC